MWPNIAQQLTPSATLSSPLSFWAFGRFVVAAAERQDVRRVSADNPG